MPRIVYCETCQQVEKMLDPPGSVGLVDAVVEWDHGDGDRGSYTFTNPETGAVMLVPETDPLMENFVGRHQHGQEPVMVMQSIHVWSTDWKTYSRMDLMQFVKEELAKQQGVIVEEAMGLKEEALVCYNHHRNPTVEVGCRDFRADEKMIGKKLPNPNDRVYLCDLCPYTQASIAQELRWKAGLYKDGTKVRIGPRAASALKGRAGQNRAQRRRPKRR